MKNLGPDFRKYFFTGLITILPLWLTLVVVWLVFQWISGFTSPFLSPIFKIVFGREARFVLQITSFFLSIGAIWFTGYLTTKIMGKRFLLWMEGLIVGVPVLGNLYRAAKKLIQSLFTEKKDFKRVALVEFPQAGSYTIGFVMGNFNVKAAEAETLVNVFIPTAPNPTTGYLIFLKQKKVIPLDISVDEAIRLIISGGIIVPESKDIQKTGQGPLPLEQAEQS
ncbi:MAG: DUF502 domain-containing protein [Endomicrobiales bacterium]|nr:DUF502 domain-containing protein [Endomicrobiales bacterium]